MAACYGINNHLFIGSSIGDSPVCCLFLCFVCLFVCLFTGVVSMWDTSQNKCIMFWKTVSNEIGNVLAFL